MKISFKWLFPLIAALFLLLACGLFYGTNKKTATTISDQLSRESVQGMVQNFGHEISTHLAAGRAASRSVQHLIDKRVDLRQNTAAVQRLLMDQLEQYQQIKAIYVATVDGDFLYLMRDRSRWSDGYLLKRVLAAKEGPRSELLFLDPSNREFFVTQEKEAFDPRQTSWFADGIGATEFLWTRPYVFYGTKSIGVTMLRPLASAKSEPYGVAGIDIELDSLTEQLARWRVNNTGQIIVFDEIGEVFLFSEPMTLLRPSPAREKVFNLIHLSDLQGPFAEAARKTIDLPIPTRENPLIAKLKLKKDTKAILFTSLLDPPVPWTIGAYIPGDGHLPILKISMEFILAAMACLILLAVLVGLALGRGTAGVLGELRTAMDCVFKDRHEAPSLKDSPVLELSEAIAAFKYLDSGVMQLQRAYAQANQENMQNSDKLQIIDQRLSSMLRSIENYSEAFIVLDENHSIVFLNKAAADLLETSVGSIFHQEFPFPILVREKMEIEIQGRKKPTIAQMYVVETQWEGESGYLVALRDISEQKWAEESLSRSNTDLEEMVKRLKSREEQLLAITRMARLFQVCTSPREVYEVISENMKGLFPVEGGAVFIVDEAFNVFSKVHGWGDQSNCPDFFTSHDCWALKTGEFHIFKPHESVRFCRHINEGVPVDRDCLCVPMVTSEEQIGLIYLQYFQADEQAKFGRSEEETLTSIRELCLTTADHIATALTNVRLQEKLQENATKDPLTATYNRRFMRDFFTGEIFRAQRNQSSIGLILLDIDFFKKFNDQYGHDAGDLVLKITGALLMHAIRKGDVCCRFGGEEFVLILPGNNFAKTLEKAEEIRKKVEGHKFYIDKNPLAPVTISLGVSCYPEHGQNVDDILKSADNALYEAKAKGRNQVCGAPPPAVTGEEEIPS